MSTGYTSPASMIALCSAVSVLDITLIGMRFYARKRQKAPLLLDDWMLVPALVFTIAMAVNIIVGVESHGIGYPTPRLPESADPILYISPEQIVTGKVEWINRWLQPLALGCIKISILAFYRRVFDVRKAGLYHILLRVVSGFVVIWIFAFFFAALFMCGTTFSNLWGSNITLYTKCSDGHILEIDEAFSISDFCFDVLMFFLPIPKIWSLHMTMRRRMLVTFVFVIGALAIIGSIIRMIIFIQTLHDITSSLASQDGLIVIAQFLFWSMLEAGLAIVAACLPTLHFLLSSFNASKFLHSIRSVLSLNSLCSNRQGSGDGSRRNQGVHGGSGSADNASASSQVKIARFSACEEVPRNSSDDTFVMADLESQSPATTTHFTVRGRIEHSNLEQTQLEARFLIDHPSLNGE